MNTSETPLALTLLCLAPPTLGGGFFILYQNMLYYEQLLSSMPVRNKNGFTLVEAMIALAVMMLCGWDLWGYPIGVSGGVSVPGSNPGVGDFE